ncbi:MAG: hypothetical protein NZ480_08230 [Bdellovibrionaceae bacterium]|nr:hypothetical protein [Pseudobdellovibrionaceae bacterium]MDW8190451.1 hypothetical protein [Pseudobdellovibrionaceae bacterium]
MKYPKHFETKTKTGWQKMLFQGLLVLSISLSSVAYGDEILGDGFSQEIEKSNGMTSDTLTRKGRNRPNKVSVQDALSKILGWNFQKNQKILIGGSLEQITGFKGSRIKPNNSFCDLEIERHAGTDINENKIVIKAVGLKKYFALEFDQKIMEEFFNAQLQLTLKANTPVELTSLTKVTEAAYYLHSKHRMTCQDWAVSKTCRLYLYQHYYKNSNDPNYRSSSHIYFYFEENQLKVQYSLLDNPDDMEEESLTRAECSMRLN